MNTVKTDNIILLENFRMPTLLLHIDNVMQIKLKITIPAFIPSLFKASKKFPDLITSIDVAAGSTDEPYR